MYQDGFYGAEIYVSTVGFSSRLLRWNRSNADKKPSPGDKNVISSAPSVLPASLPSRRRLGLCLLCQETQQQNLKPPQLLPPLSLSLLPSYDLRLWQRGRPGLSVPCQVRSFLTLDLSGVFEAACLLQPLSSPVLATSLMCCVCVHSEGFGRGGYPCQPPRGSVRAWVEPVPPSHHRVGDKRSGSR